MFLFFLFLYYSSIVPFTKTPMKQVVRTLLKNAENKILLVQHHKSDTWTLPGGHIEKWESLYQALKREIREEFGIKIKILWVRDDFGMEHIKNLPLPLAIYRINYESRKWGPQKKMEYIFLSELKDDSEFTVDVKEIKEYSWFTAEEIGKLENVFEQIPILLKKI